MTPGAADTATLEAAATADRPILLGIAYRITGHFEEAEDVVQETFARAIERPPSDRGRPWRPWLVRVTTNLSIDALRRRRRRAYEGPWLPTPVGALAPELAVVADAGSRYDLLESTSFAFLIALEALGPRQRAALVLMDALGYSATKAARALDTSPNNARVLLHRARRTLEAYDAAPQRRPSDLPEQTRATLAALVRSLASGDGAALERLLHEDVLTLTDGGGEYTALRRSLVGRDGAVTLFTRVASRRLAHARLHDVVANGAPALLIDFAVSVRRQAPRLLLRCETDDAGSVRELHVVLSARKLRALERTLGADLEPAP